MFMRCDTSGKKRGGGGGARADGGAERHGELARVGAGADYHQQCIVRLIVVPNPLHVP